MQNRKPRIWGPLFILFFINFISLSPIARAEETDFHTRAILPNNDRTQITDTSVEPYQSVCFIYVNNATQGSGVVVGKMLS